MGMREKKHFLTKYLIYAGVPPEKYPLVAADIHQENRKCLLVFSFVTALALMEMLSLS